VVVGGGLVGSSIAYHLTRSGVRTLLIDQGDLASGASGANYGLVQVQDAEFGLSLELTLQGYARFATLEAELDYGLEYRRAGYLLLIENERQWAMMEQRAARLRAAGLRVELLGDGEVCRIEPYLAPESILGALYHPAEGKINPFKLVHAYALRGRERGLAVWTHTEVTRVRAQNGRVVGVDTKDTHVPAGHVILAAGAWTRRLAQTVGIHIPIQWVHGEALITEPLQVIARNAMTSAAFFEEAEGAGTQTVAFCVHQWPRGNVMLGEAVFVTNRLTRRLTPTSLPAIAEEAQARLPVLRRAAALRAWAIPVAFVRDGRPLLGRVEELEGLLIAAGLKSTIVLTPLVGEIVEKMVVGGELDPRLAEFSPSRASTLG
jgi:sarcosine oxidase subunit beta